MKHILDYVGEDVNIERGAKCVYSVSIGDRSSIGINCEINGKTTIGNDVWIGRRAMIMPGTKIGNGVVIGAGACVAKNIPNYAIAVGCPVKIIGYRE